MMSFRSDMFNTTVGWLIIIISVFGFIGNLLAGVVITKHWVSISTNVYFVAMVSMSNVYIAALVTYTTPLLLLGIRLDCDVITVFMWFPGTCAAWLTVLISFERVLVSWRPNLSGKVCSVRTSLVALAVLAMLALTEEFHMVGGMTTVEVTDGDNRTTRTCTGRTPAITDYMLNVFPFVDNITYSVLPGLMLILLNGLLTRNVMVQRRKTRPAATASQMSANTTRTTTEGITEDGIRQGERNSSSAQRLTSKPSTGGDHKVTYLIRLSVLLSASFLLLNLPSSLCLMMLVFDVYQLDVSSPTAAETVFLIATVLILISNSISGMMYCLASSKFRNNFARLIRCCKK